MPNIAKVLKEEIARISRKEVKAAVSKIRRPSVAARKSAAALKRQVAALERTIKELSSTVVKLTRTAGANAPAPAPEASKQWISGRGIKALRTKLKLSQADFAKLAGVCGNCVYGWERKGSSRLDLREATKAVVLPLKSMGAKEAKERLEGIKAAKKAEKVEGKVAKKVAKKATRKVVKVAFKVGGKVGGKVSKRASKGK